MKSNKNVLYAIAMVVVGSFCHSLHGLSDDAVVDSIKAYSNISQADVNKWKLLWLGSAAEPTAAAASLYGMYKVYKNSEKFTPSEDRLNSVFNSQIYSAVFNRPSKTMQDLATSNWTWAGIGVAGAGLAAYKLLYLRVQAGILEKIRNYDALCTRLAVSRQAYQSEQQFQHALNQIGNTVWKVSDVVAQNAGFINLIEQGNAALLLIDQVLGSGGGFDMQEVTLLRQKVTGYIGNLQWNRQFIVRALDEELQKRVQLRSAYGRELDIQSKEIKNVTSQWKLLKDIGNTAGAVVAAFFPEEMGPVVKNYGPAAVLGIGAWKGYNWLTTPKQQEQSTTGTYGSTKAWDQK